MPSFFFRYLLTIGVAAIVAAGNAAAQTMMIADFNEATLERRLASEADRRDFMTAQISAGANSIVAATTRLIERGTADADTLAFTRVKRASMFLGLKLYAAASDDLEKALAQATQGKTFVLVAMAETYWNPNRRDRTAQYFDEAIALNGRDPSIYFRRGLLHREAKLFDLALRDFDTVITLAPERPSAYFQRAETHRSAGDIERAVQDYHAGFDRSDAQLIKSTQWGLYETKRYNEERDGRDRPSFRTALTACVREPACKPILGWSRETRPDHP